MSATTDDLPDELTLMAETAERLGIPPARRPPIARVGLRGARVALSALRWGEGPIDAVFLHGGGQNAHTWDSVGFRLGRSALAIDLPGHGRSGWYDQPPYLPSDLAEDLEPVIEQVAPRIVVGMSMGGLATIALAGRRPDLLDRVVLVDVSPGSTPDRSAWITDFASRAVFDSFDDIVDHTRSFRSEPSEASTRRSVLYNAVQLPDGRWTWRADRRSPPDGGDRMGPLFADLPRYWSDVALLPPSTTLVLGGDSPIVRAEDVERYRRLVPTIEVVTVAGSGHNVQGDAPDELAGVIARMLGKP
jgi:pimeloyl-ACP methyl ester carboxylesterase